MQRPNAPISLAGLSASGIHLRPYEAVTIVRELLLQVARGDVAGVPSAHVIRLSSAGLVSVEGPVAAGGRPVLRAAQLLDSLLAMSGRGAQFKVPGGLKLVVARALGTLDLPPFPSLEAFDEALGRFGSGNSVAVIRNLVNSSGGIVAARAPHIVEVDPLPSAQVQPFVSARTQDVHAHLSRDPLTVSDIRRARRATGLPLVSIAERSHIPIGMLRQLEWGYFANWPTGNYGRAQLVRYARAAGLDEQLVVATLLPQIDHADRPAMVPVHPAAATVPVVEAPTEIVDGRSPATALVPWTGIELGTDLEPAGAKVLERTVVQSDSHRRWRAVALAALAIPALLAIGLLPTWWDQAAAVWNSPGFPLATIRAPRPAESAAPSPRRDEPAMETASTPQAAVRTTPQPQPEVAMPQPAVGTASTPQPAARAAAGVTEPADGARGAEERQAQAPIDNAAYKLASDRADSPSFASAGTAIFYQPKESDEAGGSLLRITRIVDDAANNSHVRPSPDGRRIAFDSDRDGTRGVYVADADGKHVNRVSGEGIAAVPSWSPDGGTLAFVREDGTAPDVWNLWMLQLSTGEMQQLTRHETGQPSGGSWFPDGRRLAYGYETRLIIHDLQTGTDRTFNTPVKGRLVRTPTVSPDGRRVAFQVHRDGTWLLDLRDGSMRRILEDPTAEEYTWAPDGRRLAYHSRRSAAWGVWVMAPR